MASVQPSLDASTSESFDDVPMDPPDCAGNLAADGATVRGADCGFHCATDGEKQNRVQDRGADCGPHTQMVAPTVPPNMEKHTIKLAVQMVARTVPPNMEKILFEIAEQIVPLITETCFSAAGLCAGVSGQVAGWCSRSKMQDDSGRSQRSSARTSRPREGDFMDLSGRQKDSLCTN